MTELPELRPEDVVHELEARHRDAMLDFILAWGTLDTSLGRLLSCVLGLSYAEGAKRIGRDTHIKKLDAIKEAVLNQPHGESIAKKIDVQKNRCRYFSEPRNAIAHSRCSGYWSPDPDYVVFAKFEYYDAGQLAGYRISVQEMSDATKWAQVMCKWAETCADKIEKRKAETA